MRLPYTSDKFVNRDDELEFFEKRIRKVQRTSALPNEERIVRYRRLARYGTTWLCQKIRETYSGKSSLFIFEYDLAHNATLKDEDRIRDVIVKLARLLKAGGVSVEPSLFAPSTRLSTMSTDIDQALRENMDGKVPVLLFDNLYQVPNSLRKLLEQHVFPSIFSVERSLLVLFGDMEDGWFETDASMRYQPNLSWDKPEIRSTELRQLLPFSYEHTEELLKSEGYHNTERYPAIHRLSRGVPGRIYELAHQPEGRIEWYEEHPLCYRMDELLCDIPEEDRPALKALCAVGHTFTFTAEEIGDLLNQFAPLTNGSEWDLRAVNDLRQKMLRCTLQNVPLIYAKPVRYMFHEETYPIVLKGFQQQDVESWKRLHELMERIYRGIAESNKRPIEKMKWEKLAQYHAEYVRYPEKEARAFKEPEEEE